MSRRKYSCRNSQVRARRRHVNRTLGTVLAASAVAAIPQAAEALSAIGLTGDMPLQVAANEVAEAASRAWALDGALPDRVRVVADSRHRSTCTAVELELEGLPCGIHISIAKTLTGAYVTATSGTDSATAQVAAY